MAATFHEGDREILNAFFLENIKNMETFNLFPNHRYGVDKFTLRNHDFLSNFAHFENVHKPTVYPMFFTVGENTLIYDKAKGPTLQEFMNNTVHSWIHTFYQGTEFDEGSHRKTWIRDENGDVCKLIFLCEDERYYFIHSGELYLEMVRQGFVDNEVTNKIRSNDIERWGHD